jgi:hypothetical protein
MALKTMGSQAQNTFSAIQMTGSMTVADVATLTLSILNDQINGHPIYPGAFSSTGLLYVPNRGVLKVLPGDYVAVDTVGWPVLISALSAGTGASWVHS